MRAAQQAGPASKLDLKCPHCGTRMVPRDWHGTIIDRCPFCHGIWLDASELDRMLALGAPVSPLEAALPGRGMSAMSCPRCWPTLLESAGWSGLVLERCRRCRGLFLGATELYRLLRWGPVAGAGWDPDLFQIDCAQREVALHGGKGATPLIGWSPGCGAGELEVIEYLEAGEGEVRCRRVT